MNLFDQVEYERDELKTKLTVAERERDELKKQLEARYSHTAAKYGKLTEEFIAMRTERDTLAAKVSEYERVLQDPAAVWVNIVRGTIARPHQLDRLGELETKCAEMRDAMLLRDKLDYKPTHERTNEEVHACCEQWSKALSSDCGKGWKSPQEYAALEAKCAEMRVALEMCSEPYLATGHLAHISDMATALNKRTEAINHALSSD